MKIKNKLQICMMFLLLLPIINAASLDIISPDYIIEQQSTDAKLSIYSDVAFDGIVYLTYSNINSNRRNYVMFIEKFISKIEEILTDLTQFL